MTPIFMRSWLVKISAVLTGFDRAGEFPQGLGHQAGLQTHVAVAHLAFDFGARHQRGDRVDHDHVHRAGVGPACSAISSACSPVSGCEM